LPAGARRFRISSPTSTETDAARRSDAMLASAPPIADGPPRISWRRDAVAKFKMIALTTPVPGKEAEYHEWYQKTHFPQLTAFDGIDSAQRYKLTAKLMGSDTNQYLAIYDIETDDPMALMGAIGEASAAGKLTQTDASDMGTTYTALFEEFDEPVVRR
jgi:hypothetical protein